LSRLSGYRGAHAESARPLLLVVRSAALQRAILGQGHARHLCRDCAKLGRAVRDLDRLVNPMTGIIRRRYRDALERFRSHAHERVRDYSARLAQANEDARSESRPTVREAEPQK